MIKHVVMWKLKEEAGGHSSSQNAQELKRRLEVLPASISCIRFLEVGLNFAEGEAAWDVVLISGFDTREDLEVYRVHPDHVSVARFVGEISVDRRVVDFETA